MDKQLKNLTWQDISIKQYMEIQKIIQDTQEPMKQYQRIILLLDGTDINSLNVVDAQNKIDDVNEFLNTPFVLNDKFKNLQIGNYKCTVCDLNSMTLGQFMEYQELCKDINNNLIDILAISIVPKGAKYNDGTYDLEEFKICIENSSVINIYGVVNFQLAKFRNSSRFSLAYLTAEIWLKNRKDKKMWKTLKNTLQMAYKSMEY